MKVLSLVSTILLAALACADPSSRHETPEPLQRGTYFFDCDAKAGYLEKEIHELAETPLGVGGAFRINEARSHPEWAALVGVELLDVDEEPLVGVVLVSTTEPGVLTTYIDYPDSKKAGLDLGPFGVFAEGDRVPYAMVLNDSGEVAVLVGPQREVTILRLESPPVAIRLRCSTARAEMYAK